MKILSSIIVLVIGLTSYSQQFSVKAGGLVFEDENGTSLNKAVFTNCFCEIFEVDSSNNPTTLAPLTFPVPVELDGKWGHLEKTGEFSENKQNNLLPAFKTKAGEVYLVEMNFSDFELTLGEKPTLMLVDSVGNALEEYIVNDRFKGSFLVSKDGKSWGIIDANLKVLLPLEYIAAHHEGEEFRFSSKGYLSLRKNEAGSRFGAVNYKGKTIIPFKWKLISYVIEDEEHIYVMNDYLKRGYINIHGQTTFPFKFKKLPRELSDSNRVETEHYTYFVDRNLKQIGPKYQSFEKKGDRIFYKKDNKWGVLDAANQEVIPCVYSSIMDGPRLKDDPSFKCYIVVKNGMYGLITTEGEEIIKPAYGCLCGLSYFAPSTYYIEFKKEDVSYKFDHKGELIEKGGKGSPACFCE